MSRPYLGSPSLYRGAAHNQAFSHFGAMPSRAAVKAILRGWLSEAIREGDETSQNRLRQAMRH